MKLQSIDTIMNYYLLLFIIHRNIGYRSTAYIAIGEYYILAAADEIQWKMWMLKILMDNSMKQIVGGINDLVINDILRTLHIYFFKLCIRYLIWKKIKEEYELNWCLKNLIVKKANQRKVILEKLRLEKLQLL